MEKCVGPPGIGHTFSRLTAYPSAFASKLHNDIVILQEVVKDNIDEGKSIEYFKWMTRSLPDPKPQFGKFAADPLSPSEREHPYTCPVRLPSLQS